MLVQIRVQLAMPQLPPVVQKQGVNVQMKSPNILLSVNLYSPDGRYDTLFMSNYAQINLFDELSRLKGVGLVTFLGQREYSMRIRLDSVVTLPTDERAFGVPRCCCSATAGGNPSIASTSGTPT